MSGYQLTCGRSQVVKFHRMKRSDFSSADTYITAYQTQYNQLGLHEVEPRPFEAMFVMLYDLEGELDSVKFTYQAMKDTVPDTVTKDIFNSMCKKLIVERRDVPASSSTPNPQQMQPAITRTETSAVGEEDVDAVEKAAEEDHTRSQITKEDAWRERVGSLPCSFANLALELTYSNGLLDNTEREQLIAPKPADLETFVLHLVS